MGNLTNGFIKDIIAIIDEHATEKQIKKLASEIYDPKAVTVEEIKDMLKHRIKVNAPYRDKWPRYQAKLLKDILAEIKGQK